MRRSRIGFLLAAAVLAVAVASSVVRLPGGAGAWCRGRDPEPGAGRPLTVAAEETYPGLAFEALRAAARPTGERLVFVGLDGLDWVLLDRLIGEGRCPTFARLKRTGAWAELASHAPVLSPLIWTSMGTGRRPEAHGVLDFVVRDPATGEDTPITNGFRRVHAFWNVLSYVERKVHVVNWWATYPAEPINGVMVSERMFYQLFGIRPAREDPANVYPRQRLREVLPRLVEADAIPYEEVRRFAELDRSEYEEAVEEARLAENPYDNRINHLRKILAVTRGVFNLGRWLLDERPADLTVLYIEGTDTIGHRFAHYLPPKLDWVSREDFRRYSETMARYYELVDRELAELMRHPPPETTWIVASDHGFFTGKARPGVAPDDFTVGAAQWHRMTGVLLAAGPPVEPGKIRADIYDLCRTLLWLLGAPISRQLEGRELLEMVRPEWAAEHPPVLVETYDELPRTWMADAAPPEGEAEPASVVDAARLKELQSLGYLGGGARSPAASRPASPPPASSDLEAKPTEQYNLGKLAQQRGDLEAAERHFLATLEEQPDFAVAMASLAGVYRVQGRHEEALRYILRALGSGGEALPPTILLDFVREAEAAGRLDRVLGALDMVRAGWEHTSSFNTARGMALANLGRPQEAESEFRAALDKDPGDPVATEELLKLAAEGRSIPVDEILRRHFEHVAHDLKRLNDFAVVCLRQRRPAWAERALRVVLESDPGNGGVLSNMAATLQLQGKVREAAAVLERAVAARPQDAGLRFNYGAVLAGLGRDHEGLEQLAEADRLGLKGARVFAARAKVLFRLGREDEARAVLEEGSALHPDDGEIRELLTLLR